ncbi:MAG: PAS domain-containing protein [Deltaproteobacteria bacterium]|nr:PAS domain-containing protein [Deltaproteobacteria bacterium]
MLRPAADAPASYARLGQALIGLQDAVAAQETKVVVALLSENDAAYETLLRAARNTALGSVPAAQKEVELAAREVFADRPGSKASARLTEELVRLGPIEQRLEARLALHIESVGSGAASSEEIEAQRQALLATAKEAVEVASRLLHGYEDEWPRAVGAEIDAQRAAVTEARLLLFIALLSLTLGALLGWRRMQAQAAAIGGVEASLSTLSQSRTQTEVERDQTRQAERRVSLELALLRLEQKSLTESMRSALIVCDTTLCVRLANHVARQTFALDDGQIGRSVLDMPSLKALVDGIGGMAALSRLLTEATRIEVAELRDDRAQGTRWFYASVTPYVDEAGHVRGLILIADDVTQAIETRGRLMQTERLAAMGRLSAQVTHEIRNPLSAIALNADLLDEEIADLSEGRGDRAEAKQLLAAISREVERLTEVTDEYLRLARLRPPAMHTEDVNHLLMELIDFMGEDLRRRRITARVELDALDPRVLADAAQLRQAFMNIIKNSMESMPDGGELFVRTRREHDRIYVEVKDNGVGIPEHVLTRIFDPFYTTKEGGTGLGLPITQQIVAEHGGELTAESSAGSGTRICVVFPKVAEA